MHTNSTKLDSSKHSDTEKFQSKNQATASTYGSFSPSSGSGSYSSYESISTSPRDDAATYKPSETTPLLVPAPPTSIAAPPAPGATPSSGESQSTGVPVDRNSA